MPNEGNSDDGEFRHIENHLKRKYNELKENAGTFKPSNKDRESNIFISLCRRMIRDPIRANVKDRLDAIELTVTPLGNQEIDIDIAKEKLNEHLPPMKAKIAEISGKFNTLSFNNNHTVNKLEDLREIKNKIINLNYRDRINFASVNSCYDMLISMIIKLEREIEKDISYYEGKINEMSNLNKVHYWTFGFIHRIFWNSCWYKDKAENYKSYLNTAIIPLKGRIREHKDELNNVKKYFRCIINKIDNIKTKVDNNTIKVIDIRTFISNTNAKFAEIHSLLNIM